MSGAAEGEEAKGHPQSEAPAGETASGDPVQAIVTAPETPVTVNLTVTQDTLAAQVVVAAAVVNQNVPENIQLTPVAMTTDQPTAPAKNFQPQQEDFYRTIFYFSGMGRVIGSALAEGVYVDEKNRRNAIDPEEVERYIKIGEKGREGGERELVKTARSQAVNLSSDFRKLQSLLGSLPTFTDTAEGRSASRGLDEPIHGEIYFRAERPELFQQQQQAAQRVRQAYIIEPSSQSIYQQQHPVQNGHLIDVPWNYHTGY